MEKLVVDNMLDGICTSATGSTLISNCYNCAQVNATAVTNVGYSGGIVGKSDSTECNITNCYNKGNSNHGGIAGEISSESKILNNNYYLTETANVGIYKLGTNVTDNTIALNVMPSVLSVINGDNAFVEDTNNINGGYPILKWQSK